MTVQCCVCAKVKIDGKWIHDAIKHPHDVSHTYCPMCLEHSLAAMRAELAARRRQVAVSA